MIKLIRLNNNKALLYFFFCDASKNKQVKSINSIYSKERVKATFMKRPNAMQKIAIAAKIHKSFRKTQAGKTQDLAGRQTCLNTKELQHTRHL